MKLQGIHGELKGIPVKNLRIGNTIMWNYGYKSEVVDLFPSKTGKTITLILKSLQDEQIRSRRMGTESLVVVV